MEISLWQLVGEFPQLTTATPHGPAIIFPLKMAGHVFVYFYEFALHPDWLDVLGTRSCLSCLPNPCKQVKNVVKQTAVQSGWLRWVVWCILFWGYKWNGFTVKVP